MVVTLLPGFGPCPAQCVTSGVEYIADSFFTGWHLSSNAGTTFARLVGGYLQFTGVIHLELFVISGKIMSFSNYSED